jgi:uncharacterized membrane protein
LDGGTAVMKSELPAAQDLRPRVAVLLAACIFLFGIALRADLAYISRGYLSHDDALSLFESQAPQSQMRTFDTMPPLHTATLWIWDQLFGIGVLQARLLSALFSVLALVLMYLLASYLFDRRVALLSLLLMAVSEQSIFFGQMIRSYAMFQCFALLSSYLFVRALREKSLAWWIAFVGSTILTIYTHYYAILLIAALAVCALIYRKRYPIPASWIAAAAAAAFVAYLPWLATFRSGGATDIRRYHDVLPVLPAYFVVHWDTFFKTMDQFNNGTSPPFRILAFLAGAILFSLPAALAIKKAFSRNTADSMTPRLDAEGITIVAVLWLFPLLVALGAGALGVPFTLRYVLFCAAPYYILVAFGISRLKIGALSLVTIALILAYSAYSIRTTFRQRGDAAHAIMAHIQSNLRTGDCGTALWIMTAPPSWLELWGSPQIGPTLAPTPIAQPDRLSFRLIPQTSVPAAFTPCRRIWVLKVRDADLGPPAEQMRQLDEEAFRILGPGHSKADEFQGGEFAVSLYSVNDSKSGLQP